METDITDSDVNIEVLTTLGCKLIKAILYHEPFENIKALVDAGAPLWYEDCTEGGISPLHAACFIENNELVKFLIDRGAVWNAVDHLQNTAGDVALSLNNEKCYTIIRDAGIRSELLLTLLESRPPSESSSSMILKARDASAAGSIDTFLSSRLRFTVDSYGQEICLLKTEEDEVGVMMGWEKGIMQQTVNKLCADHENLKQGLKILNIGFGLGIIDTLFHSLHEAPSTHIIIEPHPDVLQHMQDLGWHTKPGVKILEGKWQDFVDSKELLDIGGFDVIYTDTFSEDYRALHAFFGHLPDLLAGPESRFSFFNGLGATNALFYDVYTHLSELHLAEIGIDIEWSDIDVTQEDEHRWGKTKEYFALPIYRLPVGGMRIS